MNEIQAGDYTKYDDPNTVSSNIREFYLMNYFILNIFQKKKKIENELKKAGIEADFPPVKLKTVAYNYN